ncbi:hypothetical protein V6N13_042283 [Hibiscus sabdariffa]
MLVKYNLKNNSWLQKQFEPTCVHHDPSRALGDLTGIKKHYLRKHDEKIWKCDKCSKHYAVQSDWKAYSKTCGTREYRCDCGTLFSRRDSFMTHRAFCDALAQETASHPTPLNSIGGHFYGSCSYMSLGLSQLGTQIPSIQDHNSNHLLPPSIGSSNISSLFSSSVQSNNMLPQMSATALLQKAAQLGSSSSGGGSNNNNNNDNSLLRSFRASSSTGTETSNFGGVFGETTADNNLHELMHSIACGNSPILGSSSGVNTINIYSNRTSMEHEKPPQQQQQSLNVSGGGSDRLIRDFLGVGQVLRSMTGGATQQQGIRLSSLSSERNINITALTSHQSFGGRENFQ